MADQDSSDGFFYELNKYYGIFYSHKIADDVYEVLKQEPRYAPLIEDDSQGVKVGQSMIYPNTNSVDESANIYFMYADRMTFYGTKKYAPEDVYNRTSPEEQIKRQDANEEICKYFDTLYLYLQDGLRKRKLSMDIINKRLRVGWNDLVYTGSDSAPNSPVVVAKVTKKKSPKAEKVPKVTITSNATESEAKKKTRAKKQ